MIKEIQAAVSIPVMAKVRIGHFAEAQVLAVAQHRLRRRVRGADAGGRVNHVDKHEFKVAFRLRRDEPRRGVSPDREGAAMIRSKGEAGTGNIVEAVRHCATSPRASSTSVRSRASQLPTAAKNLPRRSTSSRRGDQAGELPGPIFCAGGIATPADAALTMQLGAEGNFVGSGIFKSDDPERRARRSSKRRPTSTTRSGSPPPPTGLGDAMRGHEIVGARGEDDALPAAAVARLHVRSRRTRRCAEASACSRAGRTSPRTSSMLRAVGARAIEVRDPADLDDLDGL